MGAFMLRFLDTVGAFRLQNAQKLNENVQKTRFLTLQQLTILSWFHLRFRRQ